MNISVRVDWDSKLVQAMREIHDDAMRAARLTAEVVEKGAKSRVPIDSGDLRDAIHVEPVEDGYAVVAGDSDVFYGHIVENGSVNVPPRPFLVPALEAERDNIAKRM